MREKRHVSGAERKKAQDASDDYQSKAQMTADMKDPRYKKDPAFRKQVEEKIGRSNIMQEQGCLPETQAGHFSRLHV